MCKICCKTAKFATKLKGALNFASQIKRCVGEMAPKPGNSLILGAKIKHFAQNGKLCSKFCNANFTYANFAAKFALSRIVGMLILQQILRKFCNSHRTFCILSECMAVSSCGISHHPVHHPMEFRITLCIAGRCLAYTQ